MEYFNHRKRNNGHLHGALWGVVMLLVLLAPRFARANDLRHWQGVGFKAELNHGFDVGSYIESRITLSSPRFNALVLGPTVGYRPIKYLEFRITPRYIQVHGDGKTIPLMRYEFEVNPSYKVGGLKLANRNRVEFWHASPDSPKWTFQQIRTRLLVAWSPAKAKVKTSLFVTGELFFIPKADKPLPELRFIPTGVKVGLTERISLTLYYMLRLRNREEWSSNHIVGTVFNVRFRGGRSKPNNSSSTVAAKGN